MALVKDKVIVTCALTGVLAKREQCPYLPYTPVEIAEEAKRAYDAGAAVVHIHGREPDDGRPDLERRRSTRQIKRRGAGKRCPIIINFSTGGFNMGVEGEAEKQQRLAYVRETRPEIGGPQHGLDELREVLGEAEGLRLRLGVPEPVRGHPPRCARR